MSFQEVKAEELVMNPFTKNRKGMAFDYRRNSRGVQYHDGQLGSYGSDVG